MKEVCGMDRTFLAFDVETLGLDVFSRVIGIGYCEFSEDTQGNVEVTISKTLGDNSESQLLNSFAEVIRNAQIENTVMNTELGKGEVVLVGYNCDRYDKKMLLGRGFRYGIDFTPMLKLKMVDLYWLVKRFLNPTLEGTLTKIAGLYGCNTNAETADVSGKDIPYLWMNGEYEEVKMHCEDDIKRVVCLCRKLITLVDYDLNERYRERGR